eukprot:1182254-Prorocentrum_minimum.AAC.1
MATRVLTFGTLTRYRNCNLAGRGQNDHSLSRLLETTTLCVQWWRQWRNKGLLSSASIPSYHPPGQ